MLSQVLQIYNHIKTSSKKENRMLKQNSLSLQNNNRQQEEQLQQQRPHEQVEQMQQDYDQHFQSLQISKKSPQPPSKYNNFNQGKNTSSNIIQPKLNSQFQLKQHQNLEKQTQELLVQNQQASETLISLSNKKVAGLQVQRSQHKEDDNDNDQNQFQKHLQEQRQKNINALQDEITKKKQLIQNLKKHVAEKRKQIKQIGEQVDKDIQKNMFRIGKKKSATVNIKDIFAETKKTKNEKGSQLNEQLRAIRLSIRQTKQEIHTLEIKFTDPIHQDNIQKYDANQVRIRLNQMEIDKVKDQAKMLNQQVSRMKNIFSLQQEAQTQKSTLQNSKKLNILINQIKEQKQKQYKLQKEDMLFTEKLKFVSEKQNDYEEVRKQKKKRIQSQIKNKNAQIEIKELVKQINSIMDERNKIQNQKRGVIKSTLSQIQSYQAKNLELINKLRDIDAFLLHYYSYKSKKASTKTNEKAKTAQKLHETIQNGSPLLPSKEQKLNDKNVTISNSRFKMNQNNQSKSFKKSQTTAEVSTEPFNDKNMSMEQQKKLKPNKKTKASYQLGQLQKSNDCSVLSDGLLNKVLLKDISIYADNQHLYGIQGVYLDQTGKQVKGSKIVGKNRQQNVKKIQLNINTKNNQQLKQIKVSIANNKQILFLKISTTSNNELMWESKLNKNQKIQEKTLKIESYSQIFIKGMLTKLDQPLYEKKIQQGQPQRLILKGIGFYAVSQ